MSIIVGVPINPWYRPHYSFFSQDFGAILFHQYVERAFVVSRLRAPRRLPISRRPAGTARETQLLSTFQAQTDSRQQQTDFRAPANINGISRAVMQTFSD